MAQSGAQRAHLLTDLRNVGLFSSQLYAHSKQFITSSVMQFVCETSTFLFNAIDIPLCLLYLGSLTTLANPKQKNCDDGKQHSQNCNQLANPTLAKSLLLVELCHLEFLLHHTIVGGKLIQLGFALFVLN